MTTWYFHIWGSDDNASPQQKISFILLPYMKNLRAKQAIVNFAYFVQRDQYGIIAKLNLTQSCIFMWRFSCSSRRSFQPRSQGLSLLRSRERTLGTRLRSFWHSLLIIGRRWNSWNRLRNSGDGSLRRNSRRNWPGWRIWNTWRSLGYRKDKTGPRPGYIYEPRDRTVCNADTSLNTHNFVVKLMRLLKSMGKLVWNCSTRCLL